MSWTIKGEAGAALDATVRTLASLNVDSARLTLASLDSDRFEWSAATSDPTGAGTIVPDPGQLVEVFYSGTRRFRGHVTIPRVATGRVTVVCEGPWWWMTRIPLTQVVADDTAATATRPSYVFITQSLKTSLEALIDRGIANGVPIIRGTVATMFDFPRITLSETSIAQAMAELMSACPDSVAYFDYSAASGYPTLNITRRGVMTATTLTIGSDAVEAIDLTPRLDLEVSQVSIGSTTRNVTTGANTWATQTSGTSVPGKTQILVTSGPEIGPFLPKDKNNTVQVQTSAVSPTALTNFIRTNADILATCTREFGYTFNIAGNETFLVSQYVTGSATGAWGIKLDAPSIISKANPAGYYVVISPTPLQDWMRDENGYGLISGTLTGWAYCSVISASQPANWQEMINRAQVAHTGYAIGAGGNPQWNTFFQFNIQVQLINTAFASLTTVYRKWDYDYINPPAGLAANLLAAQNWIPYEGEIRTVADTVDGTQDLYRKYNVAGSLAAHNSMAALPKRLVYDIQRGRKTIGLGSPARTDFGTLASRFRRSPKDNIVYL